jgi:hypothetical protein
VQQLARYSLRRCERIEIFRDRSGAGPTLGIERTILKIRCHCIGDDIDKRNERCNAPYSRSEKK